MCELCRDGLVHTRDAKGYERVYACTCSLGEPHRQPVFAKSDKDKERPFTLPTYKPKTPQNLPYKDD